MTYTGLDLLWTITKSWLRSKINDLHSNIVNYIIQNGNTALHLAAIGGHSDCIKVLIQKGADVHMINKVLTTTCLEGNFN